MMYKSEEDKRMKEMEDENESVVDALLKKNEGKGPS
jgi:hypothetical protein